MVTQATSVPEAEAPPAQEVQPQVETGEAPVVETGFEGAEQPESVGVEAEQQGAAETDAEQPEPEETAEEAERRTYSAEEWNRRQSALDRRVAEIERANREALAQLQERNRQLEEATSRQSFEAQVAAYRSQIASDLVGKGYSEADAQSMAQERAAVATEAFKHYQRAQQLEKELQEIRQNTETVSARETARRFADQYGVPTNKMGLLMSATPQNMEALAKELGTLYKATSEVKRTRQAEVPAGGPSNQTDSGSGLGGMTDDQKLQAVARGEFTDQTEIERILKARGAWPF